MDNSQVIYHGGPSQVVNIRVFILSGLLFLLAISSPSLWKAFVTEGHSLAAYNSHFRLFAKIFFFVPILWAFRAWLEVRCHRYTITPEQFQERRGVLSQQTDVLELYRVKDMTLAQPFSLRMFGCGNIVMDTSDRSSPIVVLFAVKDAKILLGKLRKEVEIMRTKHGVREID